MGTLVDLPARTSRPGASPGLTAYVARPDGTAPLPAVVLLHEAFGLDDNARRHADRIAGLGYVVVAPDLFSAGGARRCLKATFAAMRRGEGRAFDDIAVARQWVLDRDDTTDAVGVIGFCMGGGFALLCAAPQHGFDVSSVNYGMLPASPEVLAGACPVVASFGGKDPSLKDAAGKLDAALTRLGVEHDVREYPGASHAFLNEGPAGPWWMQPVLRLQGFGPEPASAAQAWPRIGEFFATHLHR